MQGPELVKTRRSAAAAVELERQYSSERRKKMEATSGTRLMGRATYKGKLISGRENQGDHGVVISPRNASIFGMTVKVKIRCGSGGVKNGLNGR